MELKQMFDLLFLLLTLAEHLFAVADLVGAFIVEPMHDFLWEHASE